MNIISTLTTDHRNVDALFTRFEQTDPDDHEALGHVRDQILEHLAVHAEIEEQTLYPALRDAATDDVLEALEEHHAVKAVLAELERMAPSHERFRAKMQVVIENSRAAAPGPGGARSRATRACRPSRRPRCCAPSRR